MYALDLYHMYVYKVYYSKKDAYVWRTAKDAGDSSTLPYSAFMALSWISGHATNIILNYYLTD